MLKIYGFDCNISGKNGGGGDFHLIMYTQQKKKVDTFSTLIISYTNSIDGKWYHMKENSSSILRIIASYDLEIHAWLNTFIEQWQGRKSKISKLHQNTAINEKTLSMERRACPKH